MIRLRNFCTKKFLIISILISFQGISSNEAPNSAKSNFKVGSHVVLVIDSNSYYTKIFGFPADETDPPNKVILEFPYSLNKNKEPYVRGPFDTKHITKLFYSLVGLTDLRYGDAVYVKQKQSVAVVLGAYYRYDGAPLHCIKFVDGELDSNVGCAWEPSSLQKIIKTEDGPFHSKSFVSLSSVDDLYVVVGKINENQFLLKNYNDQSDYRLVYVNEITNTRTTNPIPLDPLDKPNAPINEVLNDDDKVVRP